MTVRINFRCTYPYQVCRAAYELMQQYHADASGYFKSLDDIYFFCGQHDHDQVALEAHAPRTSEEIELQVGDKLGIAGNHWDGYSKGTNRRLSRIGLYPSYKAGEVVRIVKMPTYPEADHGILKRDPDR